MKWEEVKSYSKMSEDETHKYVTAYEWNALAKGIVLIGLNPSMNDGMNSKTVKKLIQILEYNGYGSLCLLNLFSRRSTDPNSLGKYKDDLTNEDNDMAIKKVFAIHDADIALMWGNKAEEIDNERVLWLLDNLPVNKQIKCFGKTKSGAPKHPLMMSNKTKLDEYILPKS